MRKDPWLQRWLPLVQEHAANLPVLELGCGSGLDTATLVRAGHRVVAIDLSDEAIAKARVFEPQAEYHCQDIRDAFPNSCNQTGVVVASLSLHYFPWSEAVSLVQRIHATLQTGGVLLCRLNSTNDHHYGASGHPEIAENYFLVNGEPKRFFDRAAVERLFTQGWRRLSLEEQVIDRYSMPKAVWEVILEKVE